MRTNLWQLHASGYIRQQSDRQTGRLRAVQLAFQIGLIIVSILLIIIVLLHKGRGGGMSDMFGGGVSSSVGGSSVAERNLNRITVVLAVLWVALVVALGLNLN
jgi:preprotein translocase subunit SecG